MSTHDFIETFAGIDVSKAYAVASLATRRSQLVRLRAGERTRLRRETDPFCKKSIGKVIDILNQQIDKCEQQIDQRLQASETLSARARLLCSAPGVGQRIATSLVAWLPELGSLNRGEIAKLVGVAPLLKQSGQWKGHVMIRGGRLRVRSLLYLAALSAVPRNAYYHDFYLRLLTKGKVKKVALIAVARKLLLALNRMLATSSPWDNSFQGA